VTDPVTETDREVEAFVFNTIRSKYSDHVLIGEESSTGSVALTDAPTWICDPIDGTANFVHRFPFCCVSIAFARNGQIQLGVVYNPILNEMFYASRGGGAFLNDTAINVSNVSRLHDAAVATEFGSNRDSPKVESMLENLRAVLQQEAQAVRSLGSAALNMCYVAAGRLDLYYEYGPFIWDVAAASCIVEESGGVVLHPTGAAFGLTDRAVLVANPALAKELALAHFSH